MFITLKSAVDGRAITINFDHVFCMNDSTQADATTALEFFDGGLIHVVETRGQIMDEVGRLERQRFTLGESVTERAAVDDAARRRKAELAAQAAIDAYADTIEPESVPGLRRRAEVWRDVITDAAYTALGMD